MSIAISREDVDAVRAYVTAKDGHEYDDLDKSMVCFDITHNYLKVRMHAVHMPVTSTIAELKKKIEIHSGTPPEFQVLSLLSNGRVVRELPNDSATLDMSGFQNGCEVHCIDTNPNSLAKNGGLDDETQVEKKVMDDDEYRSRPNTYHAFRLLQESQRIKDNKTAATEYPESSVHGIHVGDRCEVNPGGRRGTVKWIGILEESVAKGGYWIGVALDEPCGKNDGCFGGKRVFECMDGYGVFARGSNVTVGDYPEEDLDLEY